MAKIQLQLVGAFDRHNFKYVQNIRVLDIFAYNLSIFWGPPKERDISSIPKLKSDILDISGF